MESLLTFLWLNRNSTLAALENLEPFLNIHKQSDVYFYRIIIFLKTLFVISALKTGLPRTLSLAAMTAGQLYIVYKLPEMLLVAYVSFSSFAVGLIAPSIAWIGAISMNYKSCEFLLDCLTLLCTVYYIAEALIREPEKLGVVLLASLLQIYFVRKATTRQPVEVSLEWISVLPFFLYFMPNRTRYRNRIIFFNMVLYAWIGYEAYRYFDGASYAVSETGGRRNDICLRWEHESESRRCGLNASLEYPEESFVKSLNLSVSCDPKLVESIRKKPSIRSTDQTKQCEKLKSRQALAKERSQLKIEHRDRKNIKDTSLSDVGGGEILETESPNSYATGKDKGSNLKADGEDIYFDERFNKAFFPDEFDSHKKSVQKENKEYFTEETKNVGYSDTPSDTDQNSVEPNEEPHPYESKIMQKRVGDAGRRKDRPLTHSRNSETTVKKSPMNYEKSLVTNSNDGNKPPRKSGSNQSKSRGDIKKSVNERLLPRARESKPERSEAMGSEVVWNRQRMDSRSNEAAFETEATQFKNTEDNTNELQAIVDNEFRRRTAQNGVLPVEPAQTAFKGGIQKRRRKRLSLDRMTEYIPML